MATTLQNALRLHQAGRLSEAARLYNRILRVDPHHADARHLLGVVSHQQGDHAGAIEQILAAVSLRPKSAIFFGNLGSAYRALGRLEDAAEACQHAIDLAPELALAHVNLGLVLMRQHNLLGARRRFEQAIVCQPDLTDAWTNLGIVCVGLGDLPAALQAYQELVIRQPDNAEGFYNLANVLLAMNRLIPAIEHYSRALELQPKFPDALNNLGTALRTLGRSAEAVRCFQLALQLHPEFSEASNNLGAAWQALGKIPLAMAAFEQALRFNPQNAAAHNNRGTVFNAEGKYELAECCFQRAVDLQGDDASYLGNLAMAKQSLGRLPEAEAAYDQALRFTTDSRLRIQRALMLPPVYDSVADLHDWRSRFIHNLAELKRDEVSLNPAQELLPVNFYLAYQGMNDRDVQRQVAELYCSRSPSECRLPTIKSRPAAGRRRIGFLSKYFCNHTIGNLTQGLIAELPRTDFEVVVISAAAPSDALGDLIRRSADHTVSLPDQIAPAREALAELQLDVLFYPDLGMDPWTWTLAHSRLAPVQCVSWGHPVTTGIPTIDAFISSSLIEPPSSNMNGPAHGEADGHYTERLIRLNTLPVYYHRPDSRSPRKPRSAYGLSETDHLYLCPQSLFKLHPEFDSLLREILERDPLGRILLIEAPYRNWTQTLQNRFDRTLGEAVQRVSFLPRQQHDDFLNLLAVADVMLDPLHFGGGNTSYQGLGVGIPIVTFPSSYMRGRVTDGCYRKLGLTEAVATSAEDFVERALRFACDADFNREFRKKLSERSELLFGDRQAVNELAEFFRTVG